MKLSSTVTEYDFNCRFKFMPLQTNEASDKPFAQVANRTLIQVRQTDKQKEKERH